MTQTTYRTVDVDGHKVFHREAGDPAKPLSCCSTVFPRLAICSGT